MIRNPNNWSCLLASAAMALDCEMSEITDYLGHDGSETGSKGGRRGFHLQEIARFAYFRLGKHLEPVAPVCGIQTPNGEMFIIEQREYFEYRIKDNKAILQGYTLKRGHACAWDGKHVLDPRGRVDPADFTIEQAWLII